MFERVGDWTVILLTGLYLVFIHPFVWVFSFLYDRKAFGYSVGILAILLILAFWLVIWGGGLLGCMWLSIEPLGWWSIPFYVIWIVLGVNITILSWKVFDKLLEWLDYTFDTDWQ